MEFTDLPKIVNVRLDVCERTGTEYEKDDYIGTVIELTDSKIKVMITNFHNSCEKWGIIHKPPSFGWENSEVFNVDFINEHAFMTPEMTEFVNSQIQNKYNRDMFHSTVVELTLCKEGVSECGYIIAYNSHNGYYPHSVYTQWEDHEDIQQL